MRVPPGPRYRRLALFIAALAVFSVPGNVAAQQSDDAKTGDAAAPQLRDDYAAEVRLAVSNLGTAGILEEGCALSGGREQSCWTAIGTAVAKRTAVDGIVTNLLGNAGLPVEPMILGRARPIDFGPPAFDIAATDMVIPAGAVALVVHRSLAAGVTGYLGRNWRLNWENRVSRNATGYLVDEGARQFEFVGKDGVFLGPPGERIVIDSQTGAPVRIRGDLTRDGYDADGRLAWRDFGNGNKAILKYDGSGRLTRVEGPHGSFLEFAFNAAGRIARIAGSTAETVSYEYSGDDLIAAETPSAPNLRYSYRERRLVVVADPASGPTTFTYDARGRLTQRRAADGAGETWQYDDAARLTRRIDAWGAQTEWIVAADGRRLTRTEAGERRTTVELDQGRPVAVTNANGAVVRLAYDTLGRLEQASADSGTAMRLGHLGDSALVNLIAAGGSRQIVGYDATGNVITLAVNATQVSSRQFTDKGELAQSNLLGDGERRFEHDAQGRVAAKVDSAGRRTTFEYDDRGRLARRTGPTGISVAYRYDDKNRVIAETDALQGSERYTYDAAGRRISRIGRGGRSERYEYDDAGHRIATIDAAGHRADVRLDRAQRAVERHFADGSWRRTVFDSQRRVVETSASNGRLARYGYDSAGRVVVAEDGKGRKWSWRYDAAGQLTESDDGLGGVMRYEWNNGAISAITDAAGAIVRFGTDALGRLAVVIDPERGSRHYLYDKADRLVAVASPAGDLVSFGYDAEGGLSAIQLPSGVTTRYQRDTQGRVVSVIHPDGANFRHEYDARGALVATTDAEDRRLRFIYDASGRLAGKKLPDGTTVAYRYAADGALIEANDGRYPVQRTLDDKGHATALTWPSLKRALRFAYDDLGRLAQLTGSAGQQLGYRYDNQSRLTAIVLPDGSQIALAYDIGDRLQQVRFPNGVRGDYRYTATGGIEQLSWTNGGATLGSWSYRYDSRSNIAAIDRIGAPRLEYQYDADGRLTQERSGTRRAQYEYAPGGDRARFAEDGTTVSYDYAGDQLTSAGADQFGYDATGNIVARRGANDGVQYQYDVEGRLAAATTSKGARVTFAYDALGERVARRDDRGTTYFLQAGRHLFEEVGADGASIAFYVYGPGVDRPLAMLRDGKIYFYHADGQGNVAFVTDRDGKVAASYETDAFGRLLSPLPALVNPFIFAGREYEPALGIYYNRARYYDPALGRFLSPDPLTGRPNDVGSFNRYVYASNAPTRYRDPFGLENTEIVPGAKPPPVDTEIKPRSIEDALAAIPPDQRISEANLAQQRQAELYPPGSPMPRNEYEPRDGTVRVRPDPGYRIDPNNWNLPPDVITQLVDEARARGRLDPKWISENSPKKDPKGDLWADFPDHFYYNGVAPPEGDPQYEGDINYIVERRIANNTNLSGEVNLQGVRDSLSNYNQDPAGWWHDVPRGPQPSETTPSNSSGSAAGEAVPSTTGTDGTTTAPTTQQGVIGKPGNRRDPNYNPADTLAPGQLLMGNPAQPGTATNNPTDGPPGTLNRQAAGVPVQPSAPNANATGTATDPQAKFAATPAGQPDPPAVTPPSENPVPGESKQAGGGGGQPPPEGGPIPGRQASAPGTPNVPEAGASGGTRRPGAGSTGDIPESGQGRGAPQGQKEMPRTFFGGASAVAINQEYRACAASHREIPCRREFCDYRRCVGLQTEPGEIEMYKAHGVDDAYAAPGCLPLMDVLKQCQGDITAVNMTPIPKTPVPATPLPAKPPSSPTFPAPKCTYEGCGSDTDPSEYACCMLPLTVSPIPQSYCGDNHGKARFVMTRSEFTQWCQKQQGHVDGSAPSPPRPNPPVPAGKVSPLADVLPIAPPYKAQDPSVEVAYAPPPDKPQPPSTETAVAPPEEPKPHDPAPAPAPRIASGGPAAQSDPVPAVPAPPPPYVNVAPPPPEMPQPHVNAGVPAPEPPQPHVNVYQKPATEPAQPHVNVYQKPATPQPAPSPTAGGSAGISSGTCTNGVCTRDPPSPQPSPTPSPSPSAKSASAPQVVPSPQPPKPLPPPPVASAPKVEPTAPKPLPSVPVASAPKVEPAAPKPLPPVQVAAAPKIDQVTPAQKPAPKPLPPAQVASAPNVQPVAPAQKAAPNALPPTQVASTPKVEPATAAQKPAPAPLPPQPAPKQAAAPLPPALPPQPAVNPHCTEVNTSFNILAHEDQNLAQTSIGGATCQHHGATSGDLTLTSLTLIRQPHNGTLRKIGNIAWEYQPNPGFKGSDELTIRYCGQSRGRSGCATLNYQMTSE